MLTEVTELSVVLYEDAAKQVTDINKDKGKTIFLQNMNRILHKSNLI
jgi:hypothetical protein